MLKPHKGVQPTTKQNNTETSIALTKACNTIFLQIIISNLLQDLGLVSFLIYPSLNCILNISIDKGSLISAIVQ